MTKNNKGPSKYTNLLKARNLVKVPEVICLTTPFFKNALRDYSVINEDINKILGEIKVTSGAFLNEQIDALKKCLEKLDWDDDWEAHLAQELSGTFPYVSKDNPVFAVRSAAECEDGNSRSYAGLYKSVLHVKGFDALKQSIMTVWKSYFSYAALLERLSAGTLYSTERMNVIVQVMVDSQISGVLFTADPVSSKSKMYLEYVEGLGDKLVSGHSNCKVYQEGQILEVPNASELLPIFHQLISSARDLKTLFENELDIEWCWDGKTIWILQIRPISTLPRYIQIESTSTPQFEFASLYKVSQKTLESFGTLPEFVEYFRSKRSPLFQFAEKHHVASGSAMLLKFNQQGVTYFNKITEFLESFSFDEVIVDTNDNFRQQILSKSGLVEYLKSMCRFPNQLYQCVVRDFIRGNYGFITRLSTEKSVMCEAAEDGLLALNRGTASGKIFQIEKDTVSNPIFNPEQMRILYEVTLDAQRQFGHIQLEWVICKNDVYIVDYSRISEDLPDSLNSNTKVISKGIIRAPTVRLLDADFLRRLSEGPAVSLNAIPDVDDLDDYFKNLVELLETYTNPPIIVVSKPYAVLAALIPYVGGFVFHDASTLCHLAILLREHEVPAIASAEIYELANNEDIILIDTYRF